MHVCEVPVSKENESAIATMKKEYAKEDMAELFNSEDNYKKEMKVLETNSKEVKNYESDEGALWDIFRRKDVPKLEEYLKRHYKEFRHLFCQPVSRVYFTLFFARPMGSLVTLKYVVHICYYLFSFMDFAYLIYSSISFFVG